ncbi:MAG: peptide chain release factor N(5)-glutamine methyltransferase [Candidatus Caldatribacteriota bacterium]|nr:peptide chain release factor N(5)-glutamine methyltransferase [Candidatus Caldatribacteriota bacterium]
MKFEIMLENKYKFQTVGQALKNISKIFKNKGITNSEREAEILLSYFLKMNVSKMYLNGNRELKNKEKLQLEGMIEKRIKKIPLQYITKHQEFMGMDFLVEKGALIPRPETEILVEEVIKRLKNYKYSNNLKIADLGTGTGVIAISIAKFTEDVIIYATDISKNSLQIALKNAQKHDCKGKIIFLQGDLFEPFIGRIEKNSLDGIISNPPYINSYDFKSLSPEVKNNEPKIALFGGIDGLDYYRKILKKSPQYLRKNGFLALEVGLNQSKIVEKLILKENNFNQDIEIIKDYLEIERVVIAYRK